jgi:hypothetical protein
MENQAKDSVYRESLRKFFVDLLGDAVYFDKTFMDPAVFKTEPVRWFVVDPGGLEEIDGRFQPSLRIMCCSRRDPECITLSEQVDFIRDALRDDDMPDGCKRIPMVAWNSATSSHDSIGAMQVEKHPRDSGDMPAADQTNYRILTYRLVWVANG